MTTVAKKKVVNKTVKGREEFVTGGSKIVINIVPPEVEEVNKEAKEVVENYHSEPEEIDVPKFTVARIHVVKKVSLFTEGVCLGMIIGAGLFYIIYAIVNS